MQHCSVLSLAVAGMDADMYYVRCRAVVYCHNVTGIEAEQDTVKRKG